MRAWYRAKAEALGVAFSNRHYVTGVSTSRVSGTAGDLRRVEAVDVVEVRAPLSDPEVLRQVLTTHHVPAEAVVAEERIEAESVVNCLGAWSPVFSSKVGVHDVTEPIRRQISLVDVRPDDWVEGVDPAGLGMIVDTSGLYFHGEGAHVLAGYSTPDEAPGFDFEYDGREFFEREIWTRLAHRASCFERCGHVRGWAGLYAVTPDCSGIADRVDAFANLFEAHSFTGRGVMQSFGVAQGMASLITTGRYDAIDLSPLNRRRFADPDAWVVEELHI